jgi:hypothetical protein
MPVYTKTNRFSSIAICVFACMNIGTTVYTIFAYENVGHLKVK